MVKSFTELSVWQEAHKFVLKVYQLTKDLPGDEKFGLISQLRRAAVSIPANFAEGFKRMSKKEKLRFFNIAQGSIEECRYFLILAKDLEYAKNINSEIAQLTKVSVLLNAYCKAIAKDLKGIKTD